MRGSREDLYSSRGYRGSNSSLNDGTFLYPLTSCTATIHLSCILVVVKSCPHNHTVTLLLTGVSIILVVVK